MNPWLVGTWANTLEQRKTRFLLWNLHCLIYNFIEMANRCITDLLIIGERTKVEIMFNDFQKVLQTDRSYETDHTTYKPDAEWLGYVVSDMLGQDNEKTSIHCRGSIEYISDEIMPCTESDDMAKFTLTTDTAWSDARELFYLLSEKYDVEVFFYADEPGMGIHQTNDADGRFFPTRYVLEDESSDTSYCDDFDELAEEIKAITGEKPKTFEEIEGIIERHELDDRLYGYEIEVVSLCDF